MKNWAYKIRYTVLRTLRLQWKAIMSQFFALVGMVFTISEIINNVFGNTFGYDFIRKNIIGEAIAFLTICLIFNWKPLKYTCFLKNADIKITLLVSDIFRQKGAIVIPTNTTFDTIMDDEFISMHSVQGQYQECHYHNALSKLDCEIENSLTGVPFVQVDDGRATKTKRYAMGTTCKISIGQEHVYLLAVADINKYGKPQNVKLENITQSLVSFWQQLNEIGHLESIIIPVIGTGRAGIKDASRDKIIQETIFSFIAAAREMKVTENLVICIHPSDFLEKNLHWDDLCEYLQYSCKYPYHGNEKAEGSPENERIIARFG